MRCHGGRAYKTTLLGSLHKALFPVEYTDGSPTLPAFLGRESVKLLGFCEPELLFCQDSAHLFGPMALVEWAHEGISLSVGCKNLWKNCGFPGKVTQSPLSLAMGRGYFGTVPLLGGLSPHPAFFSFSVGLAVHLVNPNARTWIFQLKVLNLLEVFILL